MNIHKRINLPRNASCLVALSGGGDSVALLDLAYRESENCRITLYAAKVMHGIRSGEEEDAEVQLCRSLCKERDIPFEVLSADVDTVEDIQLRYGCGPEQAAREFRRNLLENHRVKISADFLLFGHTADDNLETVFMRLLSGSGPEGLSGISPDTVIAFRPLLGFSRMDLRAYLVSRDIPWMEDRTNMENNYRRNRLRNELIPLITDIFPGWETALGTLGERSVEAADALRRTAASQLPCVKAEDECRWGEAAWDEAAEYLKALSIWDAFNHLDISGIPDRQLPWKSLKEARRSVNKKRSWNAFGLQLDIFDGVVRMSRSRGRRSSRIRILLEYDDILDNFESNLGGFHLKVSFSKVSITRASEKAPGLRHIKMFPGDWPLELSFGTAEKSLKLVKNCITEKKPVKKFPDSRGKLVYIFIEPVKEGNNAG